jgi:hypothetical protein
MSRCAVNGQSVQCVKRSNSPPVSDTVGTISGTRQRRLANRPSCYVGSVLSSSRLKGFLVVLAASSSHSRAGPIGHRTGVSHQRPSPSRNPGTLSRSCRNYDIIWASRSVDVRTVGSDVCIRRVTLAVVFARRGGRRSPLAARAALAQTCRRTR